MLVVAVLPSVCCPSSPPVLVFWNHLPKAITCLKALISSPSWESLLRKAKHVFSKSGNVNSLVCEQYENIFIGHPIIASTKKMESCEGFTLPEHFGLSY